MYLLVLLPVTLLAGGDIVCLSATHTTLNHGYMGNEIVLKLSQCFISHVTVSETEIKLFQPLKEF